MADSQKVSNSSADDTPEERKDFLRTLPYAPKSLKTLGVWDKKSSPEMFGKLGKGMTR